MFDYMKGCVNDMKAGFAFSTKPKKLLPLAPIF